MTAEPFVKRLVDYGYALTVRALHLFTARSLKKDNRRSFDSAEVRFA